MAGEFLVTLGDLSGLPGLITGRFLKGRGEPRLAMVGRSNVGKSTLINRLVGAKVAQVSAEPGKTRCVHFYLWKEEKKILADLPGYGFARAGHDERERWSAFVNGYLREDPALERAVVLLDARHGPTELDRQAISFLSVESIPVTFVFTKADALKTQAERARRRKEAEAAIRELGHDPRDAHWVSARTGDGLPALVRALRESGPPVGVKEEP
jgi:GTP-binding protein